MTLPFDIFKDAYIDTLLLITANTRPQKNHLVHTFTYPKRVRLSDIKLDRDDYSALPQSQWHLSEDQKFILDPAILGLLSRIRGNTPVVLRDVAKMKRGVLFDKSLLTTSKTSETSHPYFEGNVYRYCVNYKAPSWIEFGSKMREYPKDFSWFEGTRILLRRLVNRQQRLMASLATDRVITNKNLYVVKPVLENLDIHVILGILNSKLISRIYLEQVSQATKDDFPQVTIRDALSVPFPNMDFSSPDDIMRHDRVVELVQQMLDLHKRLAVVKTPNEQTQLERQIKYTDNQIDQLVYELYGLSKEEIQIVETSAQ